MSPGGPGTWQLWQQRRRALVPNRLIISPVAVIAVISLVLLFNLSCMCNRVRLPWFCGRRTLVHELPSFLHAAKAIGGRPARYQQRRTYESISEG